MQGGTHLAFGSASTLAAVALGGVGLGVGVPRYHLVPPLAQLTHLSCARLDPVQWLALVLAAGLGSLLPDIDQPGSLVTRLPGRQGRALRGLARPRAHGLAVAPARLTVDTLAAGGELASALLGASPGGRRPLVRALLLLLSLLCAALAVATRWLPPADLPAWPAPTRHAVALSLAALALVALLLSAGGLAGLVHALPGHHRGWTHAPPVALALTVIAFVAGPALFPSLPGVGPALALAYCSHLLADALTIRGIPLWWPGRRQPSLHLLPRPLRVRTGSGGEVVFNICWIVALPAVVVLLAR